MALPEMFTAFDKPADSVMSVKTMGGVGPIAANKWRAPNPSGSKAAPAWPIIFRNPRRDCAWPEPLLTRTSGMGCAGWLPRGTSPHFLQLVGFLIKTGENFQCFLAFLGLPQAAVEPGQ